jgi:hypothetical protein
MYERCEDCDCGLVEIDKALDAAISVVVQQTVDVFGGLLTEEQTATAREAAPLDLIERLVERMQAEGEGKDSLIYGVADALKIILNEGSQLQASALMGVAF